MKEDEFSKIIDEIIELKVRIADEFIEDVIEPLADIGNPEKLLGKPYEQWTPQDLQMLGSLYGEEPNPLSDLIFKKEYEKVKALEKETELTPTELYGG